ncbi:multicopper oxidase type 3 [Gemmatirosa kalamazoonensis]|uniref:Multicopper oxidase type 3 n=1 Tax=Gemmatirosa kalamazoonensis TaxID=861299 RepID=W0RF84_9BACT|nr:copper oxidase [Gemmatirosa kalamazoonensis]AHG89456.1 multicopper oxidase type 3 [Gemmatirosa kalamazoonensis]
MSTNAPSAPTPLSSRRAFLKKGALGALAASALSACKDEPKVAQAAPPTPAPTNHDGMAGMAPAAPAPNAPPAAAMLSLAEKRRRADEMDAMHEKGIKAFPAKTQGKGNQLMKPRMDGGVKVFELTASVMKWETAPGQWVEAWAYNEQVPGPQIRVREGDRVRLVLKNELPQSTALHFHGLELPNDVDGVPFITQPPIKPGESYTYEFVVPNSGSHMYHSHHNAATQVGNGMLGAFIVEPKNPLPIERGVDVDYVMILNDGAHGYTLNGKSFPGTEPIVAKLGQKLRLRFMNEGMMIHPMHLHGMHMTVIAKDGWEQPAPWKCDTLNVAPGERWDVIVSCNNPGTWAFHCHILPHAESEHGMFGMVTALVVQK